MDKQQRDLIEEKLKALAQLSPGDRFEILCNAAKAGELHITITLSADGGILTEKIDICTIEEAHLRKAS
jgi:hypothetical protein